MPAEAMHADKTQLPGGIEPLRPRARLGVIIPSSNRVAEPDFQAFCPGGVVPHFMRLRMTGPHKNRFEDLLGKVHEAASILGDAKCDVILLQCTGTSMSGGYGGEARIAAAIEAATGRPALTTATCLMDALNRLQMRRLVFISENDKAEYAEKAAFLSAAGHEVVAGAGADLRSDQSCIAPPGFWRDLAHAHHHQDADGIFLSCANIHAIDVIEQLEEELRLPVVTSNQVALWRSLREAGIDDPVPGLGRLGRMSLS